MIEDGVYNIKLHKSSRLDGEWPHHAVKVSLMDGNKIAAQVGTWWHPDDAVGMTEKNLGQIMSLLLGIRKENTHGG